MSATSQDLLQDTVHQLLTHTQKLTGLWDEISSLHNLDDKAFCANITGLSCVPAIKQAAEGSGCAENVVSIRECVKKVRSLICSFNKHGAAAAKQDSWQSMIHLVKQVMLEGMFRSRHFLQQLLSEEPLPLEMIWCLCREGVISMEHFLVIQAGAAGFVSSFVDQLRLSVAKEGGVACVTDVLTMLTCLYEQDRKQSKGGIDIKNVARAVIDKLVVGLVDNVLADSVTEGDTALVQAFCDMDVELDVLNKMAAHTLSVVLCHKPVMKVSTAVKEQAKWSYSKMSTCLVQLYKQLLLPFDVAGVLHLLHGILEQQEVNWRLTLSLVSVMVVCMPESSRQFLEFVGGLLQESLETCDRETTITALLLVRQACLQGAHVFISYSDWFQRTFGDSSRTLANNRKSFTFLIKLLTDLVPHESAQHIRVHISSPPVPPAKCRQMVTDYVFLAKTRLDDLKEVVDQPGQDQKPGVAANGTGELESAVSSAVGLFETSGKVPTSLLEASIFRKPYYIGQFLPALLKPRPLPDRSDAKMNLITALMKADKIPQAMYTNYVKACKKEAMQLLAGVFIDSDSDDEMELSPLEQFETSLRHLGSTVSALCSSEQAGKPKLTVSETISQVCERVEALLPVKTPTGDQRGARPSEHIVDLHITYVPTQHLQIVDGLLNFVAQTLVCVYKSQGPRFEWLHQLLAALAQYQSLMCALLRRVWSLLITQGESLGNAHLDSLAALLVEIQMLGDNVPTVCLPSLCSNCSPSDNGSTLAEVVMRNLQTSSKDWMCLGLRLTSSYLKYALCAHDGETDIVVIPEVVNKFSFLATRLMPEFRGCQATRSCDPYSAPGEEGNNIVAVLYRSDRVQKLLETFQLSLQDWLTYEMVVCPDKDSLTELERFEFHSWAIHQWYLPRPRQDGGYHGDHMALAATILTALLSGDHRATEVGSCSDCRAGGGVETRQYSRCYIINILQGITRQFRPSESQDEAPWLVSQLRTHLQLATDHIHAHNTVQHFFHICLCLPAYLLFSNSPSTLTSRDSCIASVTDLINSVLVEHLCEGVYFPASIAAYLAQGVLQAARPHHWLSVLEQVCEKCPVLVMSLMANSEATSPFMAADLDSSSHVGSLFEFQRRKLPTGQLDTWPAATVMLSHMVQADCSEENRSLKEVYHLQSNPYSTTIFRKLSEMLVLQLTYCHHFTEHKDWRQIQRLQAGLVAALSPEPDSGIITHLLSSDVDSRTRSCVKKNCLKIKYLTLVRFLGEFGDAVSVGDKLDLGSITALLQGYVDIGQLLGTDDEEEGEDIAKSVSIPELTSLNQTVIKLLGMVPGSLLKELDQDLIISSGPAITDFVITQVS